MISFLRKPSSSLRPGFRLILALLIGGLTAFYCIFAEREVPPWDPSSMVLLSRALVESGSIQYLDSNNVEIGPYFNPHGFEIRASGDPQPYSVFPPGFSLILAVVYRVAGLAWLYLAPPLLAGVGLAAAAALAYQLGAEWGSFFAVLLIGTSHVVVTFATSLWADGPSLALLLAGIVLYIVALKSGRGLLFVGSGLCLSFVVLSKFINVVFVGLILLHHFVVTRGNTRAIGLGLMSLGIAPGVIGLLAYQAHAYGGILANPYQPWGQSLYDFPLFSLKYLFVKAPPPWNDISSQAIALGLWRDMRIWLALAAAGLLLYRRHALTWLLAWMACANIAIYAVSVFTPRQFINMRYLLPALAGGYLLAAAALARIVTLLPGSKAKALLAVTVGCICVGGLVQQTVPELIQRNWGTANAVKVTRNTAQAFAPDSVVLAYNLADTFILYGERSVLNYRRIKAPNLETRNRLVLEAIDRLLASGRSVYLVKDDEKLFGSLYPEIQQRYILREMDTPLTAYELGLIGHSRQP